MRWGFRGATAGSLSQLDGWAIRKLVSGSPSREKDRALILLSEAPIHHEYTYSPTGRVAQRKLRQLDSATTLLDLASPPGNRLEALRRDRRGQHSIRINDRWRICFLWRDGDAYNVEIVDYH